MSDQLKALSRAREDTSKSTSSTSWRRLIRAWLLRGLPVLIVLTALLLAFLLFGKRFLPSTHVEVETVVTVREAPAEGVETRVFASRGATDPFAGSVLFQASGWFEADPFPHRATALVSGVVETVHVLEGQSVAAGEPIASLIREDAQLRMERSGAALAAAQAELESAQSAQGLSFARVESMRREIEVAEARRAELADLAERATELGPQVLSEEHIIQANLRLKTQDQTIASLEAQLTEREIEAERLSRQLRVQEGMLEEAQVRFREADLELSRVVIRSPVDGVVQRLLVAPGQKKMLMADNPESATVALLFQPDQMQARIDVPIAEAARLSVGQSVLVESEFLPGQSLRGFIQRIVGEADLQRNTLQVKVRIIDPPDGLRPEILCRAQFLDTTVNGVGNKVAENAEARGYTPAMSGLRILVPEAAIVRRNGREATVWAVDESGTLLKEHRIELSGESRDGYQVLQSGLRPGDRVVVRPADDLKDGIRIRY
jgi:HlyD family secretion protein